MWKSRPPPTPSRPSQIRKRWMVAGVACNARNGREYMHTHTHTHISIELQHIAALPTEAAQSRRRQSYL